VDLAPVSGLFNHSLAQVYLQTGDFEGAIRQAERTLRIDRYYRLPSACRFASTRERYCSRDA
jgi:hypothetical protein